MRQFNISPDTFLFKDKNYVPTKDEIKCVSGAVYTNKFKGFIPKILDDFYSKRKEYKKKIKFEEEKTKLVDLSTKWFDENLDPDVKKLYDKYKKCNKICKNYNYELFNVQSFTFYLDADNWSYRVEIPNVLIGAYGLFENISTLIPNKSSYAINRLAVVNNISGAREIINSLQDKIKSINQLLFLIFALL